MREELARREQHGYTLERLLEETRTQLHTIQQQQCKDNIVILCDSNGHHLDPRRLFPGRSVKKFWCPTSHSALRLLREGALGAPSHIIIHTGNKRPQHQKSGHHKSSVQHGENSEQDLPQSQSHHLKPSTSQRRATKDHQRHQRGDSEYLCSNTECLHSQPSASHTSASLRSYPHPPRGHETLNIDPEQPSENTSEPGGERQLRRCSGTTR